MNDFSDDLIRIDPLALSVPVRTGQKLTEERKKKREQEQPKKGSPDTYFMTLSKAAQESNRRLILKGLPYRFCIYREENKIFLEVVTLDKKGKVAKSVTREVSNEDFDRLIEDISSNEGLVIDFSG